MRYPDLLNPNCKCVIAIFMLLSMALQGTAQEASRIDNPVLKGVADAGVLSYNGDYYLGGVGTDGSFYKSSDLVHWTGPIHVFSMANDWATGPSSEDRYIHANDMTYLNGKFHLYWSVNYWGRDKNVVHIGHAVSGRVTGPYREPDTTTWLANRIDPKLFVDDDGSLYLYMVKFTDGNAIWVRPMKDPGSFSGDPHDVFASLPDSWETLDNKVAEGPWVFKYRKKYYLMYNANHTSPAWGNYALGVAEADSPLAFNNGNKYPYPVVESNQISREDRYRDLLRHGSGLGRDFLYRFTRPGKKNWSEPGAHLSGWEKGPGGFGDRPLDGSTTRRIGTSWTSDTLWVIKTFMLPSKDAGNLAMRIHHDGATQVWLNGHSLYHNEGPGYRNVPLDRDMKKFLRPGENTLAVESQAGRRFRFLDLALFDMGSDSTDDILYSPGQPNILRGPNGFEWWLIYMANKNDIPRGQFIDRVLFFDKTLYVDGPTGMRTPGTHPPPALPTFSDRFDQPADAIDHWDMHAGGWRVVAQQAIQQDAPLAAFPKTASATHYLFEAALRFDTGATRPAGIYGWWRDEKNFLKILLDPETHSWGYALMENGKQKGASHPLSSGFDFQAYHKISVFKNGSAFHLKIDGLPAPGRVVMETSLEEKGLPGLWSESPNSAFDGVLYTIGWDESDQEIIGWMASQGKLARDWKVSPQGLTATAHSGKTEVFKGDLLARYEFGVQVSDSALTGKAGVYAAYRDKDNFVRVDLDFAARALVISGKRRRKSLPVGQVPLKATRTLYADRTQSDFIQKQYSLPHPMLLSAILLNKTPYKEPTGFLENIHEKMNVFYRSLGVWHPLTLRDTASAHPGFDRTVFTPVMADGLRFINKKGGDTAPYIYKIQVEEQMKTSYHLRVRKRSDDLLIFLDGKEVWRVQGAFPAACVGLTAEHTVAEFNGMTRYQLGVHP